MMMMMGGMEEEISFQPGDPVVPLARPFVKALYGTHKGRLCDNCFKPGGGLLRRCVGCQKMHYCGKACQKEDWGEGHSVECKSKVFNNPESIDDGAFLKFVDPKTLPRLLRTLAKFQLSPGSFSEQHPVYGSLQHSFNDMMSNEESIFKRNNILSRFLSKLFLELQEDPSFGKVAFDEDLLRRVFGVWTTNSFTLLNEDETEAIGAGLFIPHSKLNHSCRPNAIRIGFLDRMEIRCVHPIPKGAEPLISYLAGNRDLEERRAVLQSRYNFTCACDLCTLEDSSGPLIDYLELQRLKQKLLYHSRINYHLIIDNREEGLRLFLKLYHEYDERTTNFCSMAFDVLLQFHQLHGSSVPKPLLQKEAEDLGKRLRTTFGEGSLDYQKFLGKVKWFGIGLGGGGGK